MRRQVNVVPVIGKADLLTKAEEKAFKAKVRARRFQHTLDSLMLQIKQELKAAGIDTFVFPSSDEVPSPVCVPAVMLCMLLIRICRRRCFRCVAARM